LRIERWIFISIAGTEKSAHEVIGLTGIQMTTQSLFLDGINALPGGVEIFILLDFFFAHRLLVA
jgi:hypothetical protein